MICVTQTFKPFEGRTDVSIVFTNSHARVGYTINGKFEHEAKHVWPVSICKQNRK